MICQASLSGFLRLIIIFILIYFAITVLTRYFLPFLLRNFLKNFSKRFNDKNPDLFYQQDKKEGEVNINNVPNTTLKREKTKNDEYVDFEEIKDPDNEQNEMK